MATFRVRQVLPQSVDDAGISIATTTLDTADPRTGQVYTPTSLAAAEPIWFHRLADGHYIGLFARRLTQAVLADPQPGGPLVYSAATASTVPSWAILDPLSGSLSAVETLPTHTPGDRVLRAAASRGDYLFTVSTIAEKALLQHFRIGPRQSLILQAEEIVPGNLGLGLHLERNDLWLFGGKNGKLALARKNWGRIGQTSTNPFQRWRYRTARGWSFDPDDLAPLEGDIPATGPVSVAKHGLRYYLTVPVYTPLQPARAATATKPAVAEVPARWDAKTWTSRLVDRRWTPYPFSVPLGDDQSYIGGTAYLQPQLTLTAGHTSTETQHAQTTLDGGSDPVQVFTGLASQVVRLPDTAVALTPTDYRPYTLYNKTVVSDLIVQTATGAKVAAIRPGKALTLTPTAALPLQASQWTQSAPEERAPQRRSGFPYVATIGLQTPAGHRTLVTGWGVFEV